MSLLIGGCKGRGGRSQGRNNRFYTLPTPHGSLESARRLLGSPGSSPIVNRNAASRQSVVGWRRAIQWAVTPTECGDRTECNRGDT